MGIDQARLVHYEINRAVRVRPSAKENLRADTANLVLMIPSLSSIPKSEEVHHSAASCTLCLCNKKNGSSREAKNRYESNELYRINRRSGGSNSQLSLE